MIFSNYQQRNTMKTQLTLFLLLSLPLLTHTKTTTAQPVTTFAQLDFVKVLDGSIMNAIEFQKLLKTWHDINDIQYKRMYALGEQQVTLKELVLKEHVHTTQHKDETAHTSTCPLLADTLQTIKDDYLTSTKPSEEDEKKQQAHIEVFHKIVKVYLEHINKPNSTVKYLHEDTLDQKIKTLNAREFFIFLNEVKGLIKNIMYTCIKARESYKKQCIKTEDTQAFDEFFKKP